MSELRRLHSDLSRARASLRQLRGTTKKNQLTQCQELNQLQRITNRLHKDKEYAQKSIAILEERLATSEAAHKSVSQQLASSITHEESPHACVVCYTDTKGVLPCFHRVCIECVSKIARQVCDYDCDATAYSCPVCKQLYTFEPCAFEIVSMAPYLGVRHRDTAVFRAWAKRAESWLFEEERVLRPSMSAPASPVRLEDDDF